MIDTTNQPQEPVTILRIKRKRNEEPLDALVVESRNRRKKTKGGLGSLDDGMNVFQFAETVEPNTWDDEKQKQDLETRLSTLARESAQKKQNATPPRPVAPSKAEKDEKAALSKPSSPTPAAAAVPTIGATEDAAQSPTRQPPKLDDTARKYTIVPSTSAKSQEPEWSNRQVNGRLKAPPKVHSYKDLLKASLTMYDAIPSSTSLASSGDASVDPEVAKFLPMLTDYLKINGEDPLTPSGSLASNGPREDDDDYVWDVFYSRPASFRDLYYGPGGKANIGTVTGLPGDEECSSDESEVEDEGDEDSNAEDWYKNDYPEEEDDRSDYDSEGSDIFHDASDFDDVVHERGTWDINF